MTKKFNARIQWLSKGQGGRQTGIPYGEKYAAIVVVKGSKLNPDEVCWSLIVKNEEDTINGLETISVIHYLSDEAPDNLRKDVEFELYEGSKLVAKGIVL